MPEIEKIKCRLEYDSNHDPKCRITVNGNIVHDFIGQGSNEIFEFETLQGSFTFRIELYGKDMKKDIEKFIEIKKIYLNDIDLKNKIWETKQIPEMPKWQDVGDFNWEGNLYLGHNGYIEYELRSPIVDCLLQYHTAGAKVSSNMGSYNMELLYEMKEYFSKIVKEQDEKSQ